MTVVFALTTDEIRGIDPLPAGQGAPMPGWIFVSVLLATATLLAAVAGRPLWLVVALAAVTAISAAAGARLRPDRQAPADDIDRPVP